MTVHELRQRAASHKAEMRAIHEASAGGPLSAEAQTRWDAAEAALVPLAAAEARQAAVDSHDRGLPGAALDGGDARWDELRSNIGLLAVIRAQMRDHRDTAEAGRVREISAELARRSGRTPANGLLFDMRSIGPIEARTGTTGKQGTLPNSASLVPLIQRPDLFTDRLRNRLVIEGSGATVLSDLTGDVAIPRRVTSVQPAFVAENTPLPLSDTSYDQIKMTPKTAGIVSEISRALAMQSSPSAEALARDDMSKVMAEMIDRSALLGDGTGANPLGVIPQATPILYPHAGIPSWDNVLNAGDNLEAANVTPTGWIAGPGVRRKLMQAPRNQAASFDFIMEDPNLLAGVIFRQTGILPPGMLLLGDFSQLIVGYWSAVEIVVNEFAQDAFMKGNLLIRALVTMDVQVRHAVAFTTLSPAAT